MLPNPQELQGLRIAECGLRFPQQAKLFLTRDIYTVGKPEIGVQTEIRNPKFAISKSKIRNHQSAILTDHPLQKDGCKISV